MGCLMAGSPAGSAAVRTGLSAPDFRPNFEASGVLQTAHNPLTDIGAVCLGFAAMSLMFFGIIQPSKLMTRVRFPSPAPTT